MLKLISHSFLKSDHRVDRKADPVGSNKASRHVKTLFVQGRKLVPSTVYL